MTETKRRGRPPATEAPNKAETKLITDEQVVELTLSKGLSIERAHYLVDASKDDRDKEWGWFVAKYIGG